jgi:hypothetical protein
VRAPTRSVSDKIADAVKAYNAFRDEVTPPQMRAVLENMTGAQQQAAAEVGDVQAYAALVQASLNLQRVIAANDRAALIAAVMLTQSGISRPSLDVIEGGEGEL